MEIDIRVINQAESGWTLLGKVDPNAAIVQGLGRALQTEHVQLTFIAIDLDHSDAQEAAEQTKELLDRFSNEKSIDKEYILKDGVFHVSRLAQDAVLDKLYGEIVVCSVLCQN